MRWRRCAIQARVHGKTGVIGGRAEGQTDGTLAAAKSLMEMMSLIVEQAMAALKVPEEDQEKYARLMKDSLALSTRRTGRRHDSQSF